MNKVLASLVLCTTLIYSESRAESSWPGETVATWSAPQEYNSISVKDNIRVILVEDQSGIVRLEGEEDLVKAVKLEVRRGELRVSSSKKMSKDDKLTVLVPVRNVARITASGYSVVTSGELISSPEIRVKVYGDAKVSLRTKGKVLVDGDENHDYIYNSNTQIRLSNKQ